MQRAILCALLFACSSSSTKPTGVPAPVRDTKVELAQDLAMLATGTPATAADLKKLRDAGFSRDAYRSYIAELVQRPGLGSIAPSVLRVKTPLFQSVARSGAVLKQDKAGIYYTSKPCAPEQAVQVKPWWDLTSTVQVCADSYRPDVFWAGDNACSGLSISPSRPNTPCGCGPNLVRCFKSAAELEAAQASVAEERRASLGYVANKNLPIQDMFASNASFRQPITEFLYQRWRIENKEVASLEALPDWRKWPQDGQWAERYELRPGQHAGIFTSPNTFDTVRQRLVELYDIVLCIKPDSSNVTTAALLQVEEKAGANLRKSRAGWQELASRAVCTNCHARMDYGAQFFSGWQWWYLSTHFNASEQVDAESPMYIENIEDQRGTAKRNPAALMGLLLEQPEFAACMASDFKRYAFGSRLSADLQGLDDELQQIVQRRGTFRELMTTTLQHYLDRALATQATPPGDSGDVVAFVDEHCGACHNKGDGTTPGAILAGAQWCSDPKTCSRIAIDTIVSITFDRMPKDRPLSSVHKQWLTESLASKAWPDPQARAEAMRYFRDVPNARAVHETKTLMRKAMEHGKPQTKVPDVAPNETFSTGLAAVLGVTAASVCKDHGCKADILDVSTFEK
jgi:hypothetical protein